MIVEILEVWYIDGEGWWIEFTKDDVTDVYGPFSTDEMHEQAAALWKDNAAA